MCGAIAVLVALCLVLSTVNRSRARVAVEYSRLGAYDGVGRVFYRMTWDVDR